MHEDTEKVVDVYGFHDELGSMKDVTVGTSITTIDLENETIIEFKKEYSKTTSIIK